ncbi:MAG: FKBP-type peptidyl-prolyl cis-trans isomerase [Gammaproteobacteria bacterium]|jgi:FKBP-type peptidyl-prolyl cis-trans isomerase FkpA|nr:FKBP-type peptidyl-prolyl cis-trans isomerase [Gammaproteobacteria bacterium]MBU1601096.1 FKBP-type peptidyl-prolyl cis-trans isomerase [Gammaproteobacteria bacterium]MBU2434455.1 FKBP-type peptidyl-prolyl cis-trans isomerase [Gammaproteobacteria bacterium]MBU2450859.1 FKBP-type peptidyl-prolyl cis-trans isomerase [Gammaproteobacteria bacterium]PKO44168.1 MAG: peptidylprolyl isomerase [Betaproteobacteria bacterium HGW-Betaproteobacteria-4]
MAEITTASGLVYEDTVVGEGAEAKAGQQVTVHYTGWLTNGSKFDSSKDRNDPFEFSLGMRQVIGGWDEGVQGMKIGGTRKLTIPPHLGYGARGAGGVIPPNATLVFEVELLGLR